MRETSGSSLADGSDRLFDSLLFCIVGIHRSVDEPHVIQGRLFAQSSLEIVEVERFREQWAVWLSGHRLRSLAIRIVGVDRFFHESVRADVAERFSFVARGIIMRDHTLTFSAGNCRD